MFEEKLRNNDEDVLDFVNEWESLLCRCKSAGITFYPKVLAFKLIRACKLTKMDQNFVLSMINDGKDYERTKAAITKMVKRNAVKKKLSEIIDAFRQSGTFSSADIERKEFLEDAFRCVEKLQKKKEMKTHPINWLTSLALHITLGGSKSPKILQEFHVLTGLNTVQFLNLSIKAEGALARPETSLGDNTLNRGPLRDLTFYTNQDLTKLLKTRRAWT